MLQGWTSFESRLLASKDGRISIDEIARLLPSKTRIEILKALLSRRKKHYKTMDDIQVDEILASYTAGFVDGEGSISINTVTNQQGHRYFKMNVQVSSTSFESLDLLRRAWKGLGAVSVYDRKIKTWHKVACNWVMSGIEAERFLVIIGPYLRLKKRHAKVALEFRKHVVHGTGALTKRATKERLRLALKLRDLNSHTRKGRECQVNGNR